MSNKCKCLYCNELVEGKKICVSCIDSIIHSYEKIDGKNTIPKVKKKLSEIGFSFLEVQTKLEFGNNFFDDNGTDFDDALSKLWKNNKIPANFVYLKMMKKNSNAQPQVIEVGKSGVKGTKRENGKSNESGIDLEFNNYPDSGFTGHMLYNNRNEGWNWDSSQILIVTRYNKANISLDYATNTVETSLKCILEIFGS